MDHMPGTIHPFYSGELAAAPVSGEGDMAHHSAAVPAGRRRIACLIRGAARRLSGRVYASADDRARALGWQVTETRGRLGLSGRSYRDPRFDARGQDSHGAQALRDGRHD
jgi:hypothetical protein